MKFNWKISKIWASDIFDWEIVGGQRVRVSHPFKKFFYAFYIRFIFSYELWLCERDYID